MKTGGGEKEMVERATQKEELLGGEWRQPSAMQLGT